MKKVLFILQEKCYSKNYIIYIKILKSIGYEIHIITDMKGQIEDCDEKYENISNIFKIMKYIKYNDEYEMIFSNSKLLELLIKIVYIKKRNKIIHIKNKMNLKKQEKENYNLNLIEGKYIFCSIGEFNTANNQIMQLESMIRIIKKYPQVKLLLVGKGRLKEYYEHIIEKYGLSENVEIIENIYYIIDIIQKSNCIISTRKKEEIALDTMMAVILNKPIIASNVGMNKFVLKQENIFKNSYNLKEKMKNYIEENKSFEKYYSINKDMKEKILKVVYLLYMQK